MSKDKQIEEMAKVYEEARIKARETLGSMNEGADVWYAKAFYNAGYRKQEWISVEERLPDDNQQCLAYATVYFIPDHNDECDHFDQIIMTKYYKDLGFMDLDVHYWMPLPEAPKGDKTDA